VPHDFKESLARSHAAEDLAIWRQVYEQAFPTMQAMINHRQDGDHQRRGIDRSIILRNSKQILIDEKIRFKPYNDILLEVWSDKKRRVPGWVAKDLLCDFIAYAVAPLGVCYLLPTQQLRHVWRAHGRRWYQSNFRPQADNGSWITESVVVPADELMAAIQDAMTIKFGRQDEPSTRH
jgi:hypothetical protein